MSTENKAPFIFLVKVMNIVVIIYVIYLTGITIFNMTLKETYGEIVNIHDYEETYYYPRGNHERRVLRKDIYYRYNINGIYYTGKRLSNLLIFPNFDFAVNNKVIVYYSTVFTEYSVLFKGNFMYIFYNIIPIIVLEIIIYKTRKKYNIYEENKKELVEELNINKETKNDTNENTYDKLIEMEDIFIEEIRNGEKSMPVLKILRELDRIIIESLFKTEQIPYKIKYVFTKVRSSGNFIFYILERDYEDALYILKEYTKNKSEKEREGIIILKKQYGA